MIAGFFIFMFVLPVQAVPVAADKRLLTCPTDANGIAAPGCEGSSTLAQTVSGIMNMIFFLSFLLVLFFLVWGGIKWVLAQGEKDAIGKARDQVTNSLIGLVVILSAYVLLNLGIQLVLGRSLDSIASVSLKDLIK